MAERVEILLVEDDPNLLPLFEAVLRRAGFGVTATRFVEAALDTVEQGRRFDLLVTDLSMTPLNGRDLASRLTAMMAPPPGVLYLSGREFDDSGLPQGAPFLKKPFSPDALVAAVRLVLGLEGAGSAK